MFFVLVDPFLKQKTVIIDILNFFPFLICSTYSVVQKWLYFLGRYDITVAFGVHFCIFHPFWLVYDSAYLVINVELFEHVWLVLAKNEWQSYRVVFEVFEKTLVLVYESLSLPFVKHDKTKIRGFATTNTRIWRLRVLKLEMIQLEFLLLFVSVCIIAKELLELVNVCLLDVFVCFTLKVLWICKGQQCWCLFDSKLVIELLRTFLDFAEN